MPPGIDRRTFLARAARLGAGVVVARSVVGTVGDSGLSWPSAEAGTWLPPAQLAASNPVRTAGPPILPRAAWGADESLRRSTGVFHPVRKLVVHHTVTPNRDPDPADTIRRIYGQHLARDAGRWSDIGYHFLIDAQGRIYEGRHARSYDDGETHDGEDPFGRAVQGSHAGEVNAGTMGVALLGDFTDEPPQDAALDSLVRLLAWKCAAHGLFVDSEEAMVGDDGVIRTFPTIIGHRSVRRTACPGNRLSDLMPAIRTRVARRVRRLHDAASRGITASPGGGGYWVLDDHGGVYSYGEAAFAGSIPGLVARGDVSNPGAGVAIVGGASGHGYSVLSGSGTVLRFGDARLRGALPDRVEPVDLALLPSGSAGYALDRTGEVHPLGRARHRGSVAMLRAQGRLRSGVDAVALAVTPSGKGYAVADRLGGVYTFGDAPFVGSVPGLVQAGRLDSGIEATDIAIHPSGKGYWVLDRAGGIHPFGRARDHGSPGANGFPGSPSRRIVADPGGGYLVVCDDGAVLPFGGAGFHGHGPRLPVRDLAVLPVDVRPSRDGK